MIPAQPGDPGHTGALDPGLARERTSLSWTRTGLALMVNGLLLLVRHESTFPLAVSVVLAALAGLVALLAVGHGWRRAHLADTPDDQVRAATGPIVSLGLAITLLCLGTAAALVTWR